VIQAFRWNKTNSLIEFADDSSNEVPDDEVADEPRFPDWDENGGTGNQGNV